MEWEKNQIRFVSLLTNDLRMAGQNAVRRNMVRQKIKSTRDHLLSNYVVDVMDRRVARMLKKGGAAKDDFKPSFFRHRREEEDSVHF